MGKMKLRLNVPRLRHEVENSVEAFLQNVAINSSLLLIRFAYI